MRKILFFAIALVAGALAFTSCEDGNKVNNPLVGTWRHQTEPAEDSGWFSVCLYTFNNDGTFASYDYAYGPGADLSKPHDGFVRKGTYEIKDDIITLHCEKYGQVHEGTEEFYEDGQPMDETVKFRLDGSTLYLTFNFDSNNPWTVAFEK